MLDKYINYDNNKLKVESSSVNSLVKKYGSPLYIYSKNKIIESFSHYKKAFGRNDHLICYAVKANSNIAILQTLAKEGSGFDIVSYGELLRVLKAGGEPSKVIFSGVGKSSFEIEAALKAGIHCFNIESIPEMHRVSRIAEKLNTVANVSFRINPNIDAKSHPYISTGMKENKFGIAYELAIEIYQTAAKDKNLNILGIDCHIGSQITEISPFIDSLNKMLELIEKLQSLGIKIKHLDLGGGIGVKYNNEVTISIDSYVEQVIEKTKHLGLKIILEPGRSIVANAGILASRVEYTKETKDKNFCIIDAGMNDLLRPSIYNAYHEVISIEKNINNNERVYDIVGPICETGDFLAKDRKISVNKGDILAILSSGAYGFTMSSNYNSRPMAAEVIIDDGAEYLVKKRQTHEELFANESLLDK